MENQTSVDESMHIEALRIAVFVHADELRAESIIARYESRFPDLDWRERLNHHLEKRASSA